jgi:hypothetical protein
MAPDSPPQTVLAGRNLRAELFEISGNERFSLISKMQGLMGDGAAVLFEEPASVAIRASPAGRPILVFESVQFGPFGLGRGHQKRACPDGRGGNPTADTYFLFALTGGPFFSLI